MSENWEDRIDCVCGWQCHKFIFERVNHRHLNIGICEVLADGVNVQEKSSFIESLPVGGLK